MDQFRDGDYDDSRGESLYENNTDNEVITSKRVRERNEERKMILDSSQPEHTNCCSRGLFKLNAFIWQN